MWVAIQANGRCNDVRSLYDVGGNTGKWALQCVGYNPEVEVTILDLPQQIAMMQANVKGKPGAERISGYGINLLDEKAMFPKWEQTTPPSGHPSYSGGELDAIWMSQFLDCFSMDEIRLFLDGRDRGHPASCEGGDDG